MRKTWKNAWVATLTGILCLTGGLRAEAQTKDMTIADIFHDPAYKVKTPAGLQYRLQGDSYDIWEDAGLVRVRQDGDKREVGRDTLVRWTDVAAALGLKREATGNDVFDFIWNPQRTAVLLLADREAVYRWSFRSTAWLLSWDTPEAAATGKDMRVWPVQGRIQ
ncbi:MAG: hypothetical protein K2O01_06155, partial [Bacteroidales bacterium]|nr:hypothetical protein [Bacteroidales bacterium]